MPCQPIIRQERELGEASASVFFTCKCYNVIINTWHGAWLNYPACLIKGAPYCSSQALCHLPLSVIFHHLLLLFCLFSLICISLYIPFDTFLSSYLLTFSLLPSRALPGLLIFLPPFPLLPPLYHSAVFTVIHYHFFRQLALTVLSFVRSHWRGPLGDKEMTEGGLYLPLWPLPCRLLNHVANRQHCLPARPHPDNGEPHSYLIQWSV